MKTERASAKIAKELVDIEFLIQRKKEGSLRAVNEPMSRLREIRAELVAEYWKAIEGN